MLEPGQCAAGAGSGQPSAEDFGLDIFGVGDAATTGIGLSGKLAKLALIFVILSLEAWRPFAMLANWPKTSLRLASLVSAC